MSERPSSFEYEELLACGRNELFGSGDTERPLPPLPLPPMLMFSRISHVSDEGGTYGKGQIKAELEIAGNPALDWFFDCHFKGDPVMPGCLGLDALWQLTGFYLGWMGARGNGRALGAGEVKFIEMVLPTTKKIEYVIDIKRIILRRLKVAQGDGAVIVDGVTGFTTKDLKVGLFEPDKSN